MAARRADPSQLERLEAIRAERFELMAALAQLPGDTVFFTQITMEAAEDPEFLDAMRRAHIRGALIGVEAVTPEGLKDIYKDFNHSGDALVARLQQFRRHGLHVLGSFIFGLPSDTKESFGATVALAERANLTFAQFVLLTPFPGTVDFDKWAADENRRGTMVEGVPITRHWLIPEGRRPRLFTEHPTMSLEEIRLGDLTRRAAEELVRSVLGDALPAGTLARILERGGGNAFYIEELIRAVADGRELPETVVAMAQIRMAFDNFNHALQQVPRMDANGVGPDGKPSLT